MISLISPEKYKPINISTYSLNSSKDGEIVEKRHKLLGIIGLKANKSRG